MCFVFGWCTCLTTVKKKKKKKNELRQATLALSCERELLEPVSRLAGEPRTKMRRFKLDDNRATSGTRNLTEHIGCMEHLQHWTFRPFSSRAYGPRRDARRSSDRARQLFTVYTGKGGRAWSNSRRCLREFARSWTTSVTRQVCRGLRKLRRPTARFPPPLSRRRTK